MPVSGRNTQEPDLANPSPGTRRKQPKNARVINTKGQIKSERKLRDKGGMTVGIKPMTPYRSGVPISGPY
jgi:hypothetical protein